MTTMSNAMSRSPKPAAIIGGECAAATWRGGLASLGRRLRLLLIALTLPVLLAGCSAVRLAYNQAPELAYWWLDGYVDFSDAQKPLARGALHDWFVWHRRDELPQYAQLLAQAREQVLAPATPEQACRWFGQINERVDAAFDRALPPLADVMRRMTPAQIAHLERKYASTSDELENDFVKPRPQARQKAQLDRVVDRAEMIYGRLDAAQRARIAEILVESPFDAPRWLAERRARQQDALRTLARLSTEQASVDDAERELRRLAEQSRRSPDDAYRAYQQRLIAFNCSFAARVHNLTTVEQRATAAGRFKSWEEDARVLSLQAAL
jgi:hypothetical protein